ncbi:hypothetical protein RYX36_009356 [Vicia faba]
MAHAANFCGFSFVGSGMAHRQPAADNGSDRFNVRALIQGVNYYVKSIKFEQDYPLDSRERLIIEERVEREYFGILRQNYQFEMQRRQWRYIRETPHYDMFRKFDSVR